MNTMQIADRIKLLTMNVEGILFEGMWHMPHGVTLNSYIVKGKETAIIDGFCGWDGIPETLYKLLDEVEVELDSIKYLIINHMEPDHSGWIEDFMKVHKNFEIYCTKESAALLRAFFHYEDKIHEITDGEELDLGEGKVLQFHKTPNIHWPDTMMTFEKETGTLFSCDAFGSFGMLKKNLQSERDERVIDMMEGEQIRYFSAILGAFALMVGKGIDKVEKLPLKIIAPGHGLVWDKDPQMIIDDYRRYVGYQCGTAEKKVVMLHGSMYGMTSKMVKQAERVLEELQMPFITLPIPGTDLGTVLRYVSEASGLIVAAPTYEYKMFPPIAATLDEIGKKRVIGRKSLYFGSYGWSGGALKEYNEIIERNRMKYETIAGIEFNGLPTAESIHQVTEAIKALVSQL